MVQGKGHKGPEGRKGRGRETRRNVLSVLYVLLVLCVTGAAELLRADDEPKPAEWLKVDAPAPKRGMDLDIPGLRAPEFAAYAALQFGSNENDVVYLVFDCEARLKPYDRLHVYVPGHRKYSGVVRLSARKTDEGYAFRKILLEGRYGPVEHQCSLEVTGRTQWDAEGLIVCVEAQCSLRDEGSRERCRFALCGPIKVTLNSAVVIPCGNLIREPGLDVRWDHRSTPPHVRGRISMGALSLDPTTGFKRKAVVEVRVRDAEKPQYRLGVLIEPSGVRREFRHYVRTRLRPSTEYQVSLSVDMGALFGVIRASDQMVLR